MADITSTSTTAMPSWAQPFAQGYLNRAQATADSPFQAYSGQRVAGFNPYQQQGLDATAQRAFQGSPVMSAANGQLTNTINGGNLQGNPFLQQQIDGAQGDVVRQWNNVAKPQWDTSMQASGSFGNSGVAQAQAMAQEGLQRQLGNIDTTMRANNYNTERGYQMQATGMAPTFAQQDYNDLSQLAGAGNAMQAQQQRGLDADYAQFLDAQAYPQKQLDILGNALGRSYGGTTSQTQPGPSTGSQLAGGALTGAAIYEMLFGKGG